MREIKFRAFENEKMHYFDLSDTIAPSMEMKVMQYTGLKDKNGKEIYEGDVFRSEEEQAFGDDRNYHVVTWIRERAAFYLIDVDVYEEYMNEKNKLEDDPAYEWLFEDANLYDFSIDTGLDLVGNIHENPELLKQ